MSRDSSLTAHRCFEKVHLRIPRLGQIEPRRHAERQRDVIRAHMPTSQANTDRPVKLTKRVKNRSLEIFHLFRRNILPHIPKDNPSHFVEKSRIAKMKQHPIPLIRLGSNVFEKENAVFLDAWRIWRAKRLRKDGQTSARHQTLCLPGPQHTKPLRCPE